VRYEGQVKQRQQKELAESVIAKVTKELENPKALQQILQQSVADVESECPRDCHLTREINDADAVNRDPRHQVSIDSLSS
jgi:uncharacterized protein YpiB (UPF0302 family)